jgi:hypothetical protein
MGIPKERWKETGAERNQIRNDYQGALTFDNNLFNAFLLMTPSYNRQASKHISIFHVKPNELVGYLPLLQTSLSINLILGLQ